MAEEEIRQQMILDAQSVLTTLPNVNALFDKLAAATVDSAAGLELFNTSAARGHDPEGPVLAGLLQLCVELRQGTGQAGRPGIETGQ